MLARVRWAWSASHTIQQCRHGHYRSILGSLSNLPSSYKLAKRVGRGPGSDHGKTSGRGQKGQNSRSGGGPPAHFEGGQTPITKAFPKRGFHNYMHRPMVALNLSRVQQWINGGRLRIGTQEDPITMKDLLKSKCVHQIPSNGGVKLLARDAVRLKSPIHLLVSRASETAIQRVEEVGGSVTSVYYNRLGLRALLHPKVFDILPKQALPTRKNDVDYYKRDDRRGYLSNRAYGNKVTASV